MRLYLDWFAMLSLLLDSSECSTLQPSLTWSAAEWGKIIEGKLQRVVARTTAALNAKVEHSDKQYRECFFFFAVAASA
jgi:hypothetical protein